MATLIAAATGNFGTAGTWKKVAAAGLLESSGGTTALTTGNLDSAAMVLGAVAVDAVALKLASRAAGSPSNTITVHLRNSTTATNVLSLTLNVSDLPACGTTDIDGGWIVFKFGGTTVPNGTDSWVIRVTLSATTTAVSLYTNGTANNWARGVRETTTQAPAAGDNLIVAGEHTGAGTGTDFTVTMDSTAATDFGTASTSVHVDALSVAKRGTLKFGTTAATNYLLRVSGNVSTTAGGTFSIGDSVTQMPRDSTGILELDCAADSDFGFIIRNGTCNLRGLSRTSGKDVVVCKLNTDEAAAQTVLGVDTDTGWLNGDEIAIASTSRTHTETEARTLSGNATATEVTVSAGLTNAHGGSTTSKVQAEVVLLTRNVIVRSVSTTAMSYTQATATAVLNWQWNAFRYMGFLGPAAKSGVRIESSTAFTIRYAVIRDGEGNGFWVQNAAHTGWSIRDTWVYNTNGATGTGIIIDPSSVTPGLWTLRDVGVIGGGGSDQIGMTLGDLDGDVANITVCGRLGDGLEVADTAKDDWLIDGLVLHCTGGSANGALHFVANLCYGGTVQNFTIYRNTAAGIVVITNRGLSNVKFITGRLFGNGTTHVSLIARNYVPRWLFRDVLFAGDTTFSTTWGILWQTANDWNMAVDWVFETCTFGVASGIYVAHVTSDLNFRAAGQIHMYATMLFNNCILASTELAETFDAVGVTVMDRGSYLAFQRYDQTANTHKTITPQGTVTIETGTVDVTPGMKLTPISAAVKLDSAAGRRGKGFLVAANSGQTITPAIMVRKNAAYNGNAPRLIAKANPAVGITADVVLDTFSVGVDTWETLTGTTAALSEDGVVEFIVDCDGTAGDIFIDTASA